MILLQDARHLAVAHWSEDSQFNSCLRLTALAPAIADKTFTVYLEVSLETLFEVHSLLKPRRDIRLANGISQAADCAANTQGCDQHASRAQRVLRFTLKL
jgi:hypothetical protein